MWGIDNEEFKERFEAEIEKAFSPSVEDLGLTISIDDIFDSNIIEISGV